MNEIQTHDTVCLVDIFPAVILRHLAELPQTQPRFSYDSKFRFLAKYFDYCCVMDL
jgi:hypothetical protein